MSIDFSVTSKHIADEIIGVSLLLNSEIETWLDVFERVPDSTSKNVSAGFISKPNPSSNIEIVVDIQAPEREKTAKLRIWAIEITEINGNQRFNNIQLDYHLDYLQARQYVDRASRLVRDDFTQLLHDPTNQLEKFIISDVTGMDTRTQQPLGTRYDIYNNELNNVSEQHAKELQEVMVDVISRIKLAAATYESRI